MANERTEELLLSAIQVLNGLDVKVAENTQQIADLSKTVMAVKEETTQQIADLSKTVMAVKEETTQQIADLSKTVMAVKEETTQQITDLNKIVMAITNELERQRQNMVVMEHNITEQIRALFDVREINNDKFKEHDAKIEGIDHTLDWHNRRLLKLETSN